MFEPGHTEVEFRARHMMVTWVRGLFKDIRGHLEFELDEWRESRFEGVIDMARMSTGEPTRDDHLRSADFFDVAEFPRITFAGRFTARPGDTALRAEADVTIRGTTRTIPLDVTYLGEWRTPWWEGDVNRGEMRRIGFEARTRVDRRDFGVSWQDELPDGGVVVSDEIEVVADAEAILGEDLERTGAIEYYRSRKAAR